MNPDPAMLDELVRRTVEAVRPLRVILFGSAVRGTMGPDSDLDLLVIMPDAADCRAVAKQLDRRLRDLNQAKDIVVARESDLESQGANPYLVFHAALAEGKELDHAASYSGLGTTGTRPTFPVMKINNTRSHAPRGNAVRDAPRRLPETSRATGDSATRDWGRSGLRPSTFAGPSGTTPKTTLPGNSKTTRSVANGIPTRSVGTSVICLHNWKPGRVCHSSENRCNLVESRL